MARNQDKYLAVRKAYTSERLDLSIAAAMNGVPYSTANRWKSKDKKNGDDWDKARNAARLATGGLGDLSSQVLEDFTVQYQSIMDHIKEMEELRPQDKVEMLTSMADSFVKICSAVGKSNPQMASLAEAMKVLELLSQFIEQKFPQHAATFIEILQPFGVEIEQHYGG